jgi:hypothetical protein
MLAAGEVSHLQVTPEKLTLSGVEDGRQLQVGLSAPDGRLHDLTREAHFTVTPPGVVRITPQGYVVAAGKGEAVITVQASGQTASVHAAVSAYDENSPVHFSNDVVPILTRFGCNAGGCHGKASGQNGFKLSLFGFDPAFDYNALVGEARGRRIFPAAPDRSLLLTKPTGQVPHGGGRRFDVTSEAYRLLRRWIIQGMPVGDEQAPTLQTIAVAPAQGILERGARQQLAVVARYSNGSIRDVTRQVQFQSNEPTVAAVGEDGLVRTLDLAGEAAIMARYQGLVAIFQATVPLERPIAHYPDFPAGNYIDTLALAKWKKLGLVPSALCTDGEFIRRVTLDLCGKLPTVAEVREFLVDPRPDKRARLIDRRLDDKDYAAYFALRWGTILRNAGTKRDGAEPAAYAFHDWLRDQVRRNVPYDQFARGVLTATGSWQDCPPINWYWQMVDDPLHQPTADAAQLFLGQRLQCARCHHHPFERWGQEDYYGLAGFFARLGHKDIGPEPTYFTERQRVTDETNPRTGQPLEPKLLGGKVLQISPRDDPREKLVDWMVRPDNPYFAKALCNRVWGQLMGRGLVDPVDDMRATNPPSNPELLDALAQDFLRHKFDVKHMIRTICNSRTYQLSAEANDFNRQDHQNHARCYPRRLIAEVFLDAVDQVCGTKTGFNKVPVGSRAVDLPHEGFDSYFLDVFDRPARSSACECARTAAASLTQVLHLSNAPELEDKIASDEGRIAKLIEAKVPAEVAVEELYLAALARKPTPEENKRVQEYLAKRKEPRQGLEDVLWALLNSAEFAFNQ